MCEKCKGRKSIAVLYTSTNEVGKDNPDRVEVCGLCIPKKAVQVSHFGWAMLPKEQSK
jgi:hypothetical protein